MTDRSLNQQPTTANGSRPLARIFVCYHKPSPLVGGRYLCPIHVGRQRSAQPLEGMIGDDTGENISARNHQFCEQTALYWAWKNDASQADYIGLMHYRRLFDFTGRYAKHECYDLKPKTLAGLGLVDEQIESALAGRDLLLPAAVDVPGLLKSPSVYAQYCREHSHVEIDLARAAVARTAPETLEDFDAVCAGDRAYFYTMFVMRRELFQRYMEWLFPLYWEMDQHIAWDRFDAYQQRAFAFLGERLLSVFVHHLRRVDGAVPHELPMVFLADKKPGFGRVLKDARRRVVRLKVQRDSVYFKLLGREFRYGNRTDEAA